MKQTTGARDSKDPSSVNELPKIERRRSTKVLSEIEEELKQIHQQIDHLEEIIRRVFKDNAA